MLELLVVSLVLGIAFRNKFGFALRLCLQTLQVLIMYVFHVVVFAPGQPLVVSKGSSKRVWRPNFAAHCSGPLREESLALGVNARIHEIVLSPSASAFLDIEVE